LAQRTQLSGKLVILGIVGAALAAAGTSWWFRYSATHEAAVFWGSARSHLIRSAPVVKLFRLDTSTESSTVLEDEHAALDFIGEADITKAPGLLHLRSALLEDRSFRWPETTTDTDVQRWQWALFFHHPSHRQMATLLFSRDWKLVTYPPGNRVLSCEPIAEGLATMLAEQISSMPEVR
jgi:hypothetical protein